MAVLHTSHTRYELWYHFAWSTKYRKRVFTNTKTQAEVKAMFRTIAAHYDIVIGELACLPDHIHLTAGAPPRIAPASIAQILKSVSTKLLFEQYPWLKQHYWGGEAWTRGYFVRSFGPGLTTAQINRYIREQSVEA